MIQVNKIIVTKNSTLVHEHKTFKYEYLNDDGVVFTEIRKVQPNEEPSLEEIIAHKKDSGYSITESVIIETREI